MGMENGNGDCVGEGVGFGEEQPPHVVVVFIVVVGSECGRPLLPCFASNLYTY